jgi:hypothetical protein
MELTGKRYVNFKLIAITLVKTNNYHLLCYSKYF